MVYLYEIFHVAIHENNAPSFSRQKLLAPGREKL